MKRLTRTLRGLLLVPTLNLLSWILKQGNSLIIGGPLGWSWYSTIDTTHHGSLEGPANAHRHSDLASVGIDDHHARDHATRHQNGGADEIGVAGLSGELADLQKVKDHSHQSAGGGVGGKLDHGLALSGLTDDDHTLYIKANGTRPFTGNQSMGGKRLTTLGIPTATGDALRKGTALTTTELPNLTNNKIWAGNASNRPVEEDKPSPGIWTLFETLSPSVVNTISSSALAAHDLWMVLIDISLEGSGGVPNEQNVTLRFNADAGNNYGTMYADALALVNASAQSSIMIGSALKPVAADTARYPLIAQLLIKGKSPSSNNNSRIAVTGMTGSANDPAYNRHLQGYWKCGTNDVSSMTIFCSVSFTGKIKIYYMDY